MDYHTQVESLLIDLECELRRLHHWQSEPLGEEALQSREPFGVDTMSLAQWLQFVFVPRVRAINAAGERLPGNCAVAPIAQQYFSLAADRELVRLIGSLDELLNSRR